MTAHCSMNEEEKHGTCSQDSDASGNSLPAVRPGVVHKRDGRYCGGCASTTEFIHFDVNTGDATLIDSSDGHGVLIDAGDKDHGLNPIKEFLDRATRDGHLVSLDYAIVTHYDPRRITSSSY